MPRVRLPDVVAGPDGYVAVGVNGGSAASWVSADGRSWQAAPASPALSDAVMSRVFRLGSDLVAIGHTSGSDGLAWRSVDGLSWSRFGTGSMLAGVHLQAAAVVGTRYLLFGRDATGRLVVLAGDPAAK